MAKPIRSDKKFEKDIVALTKTLEYVFDNRTKLKSCGRKVLKDFKRLLGHLQIEADYVHAEKVEQSGTKGKRTRKESYPFSLGITGNGIIGAEDIGPRTENRRD